MLEPPHAFFCFQQVFEVTPEASNVFILGIRTSKDRHSTGEFHTGNFKHRREFSGLYNRTEESRHEVNWKCMISNFPILFFIFFSGNFNASSNKIYRILAKLYMFYTLI